MKSCYRCGAAVAPDSIGVRDTCEGCHSWLHCCRNCAHYEPGAHNDCREPNAELVAAKEDGNFCDFFRFADRRPSAAASRGNEARERLDALFRKK